MMQLSDFDFDLPEALIALEPLARRDQSRLLCVGDQGRLEDHLFKDVLGFFEPGDVLILNDSKVLPAALSGVRQRAEHRASVHLNLHKRISDHEWLAFAKPLKRLKVGDRLLFGQEGGACLLGQLEASISKIGEGGEILVAFDVGGSVLDEQLHLVGQMPLPPYIAGRRAAQERDKVTYQTVYARDEGSVAAPTAGLHFTDALLDGLRARGVLVEFVTLHVGAGTFLPVKVDNIETHKMHFEWGVVDEGVVQVVNKAKLEGRRVTAVGTTSLRLLEAAALDKGGSDGGCLTAWQGETDIFIRPGFDFKVVDRLLTNFHLPKSTLFMLVSAFSGLSVMQKAYAHAMKEGYRFYSYGDACFLQKQKGLSDE